jgi:hypothetical protein
MVGAAWLLAVSTAGASIADAQTVVQLTFGGSTSFGAPTAADYTAGTLETATPLSFQVQTTSEPSGSFTTHLAIRSASSSLGGGKPVSHMEWRRGDDSQWRALTTNDVTVESRTVAGDPLGHTWDNTIYFRVALQWSGDRPGTYAGNLIFTLTASQP